jgi:hypothetical protein
VHFRVQLGNALRDLGHGLNPGSMLDHSIAEIQRRWDDATVYSNPR